MKKTEVQNIEILFQNEELVMVNKPWDICINGNEETCGSTVASLLQKKFPLLADFKVSYGFRFPHQLDYATSGALCISLNKEIARSISLLFKQRKVFKQYIALVHGKIDQEQQEIVKEIGEDSTDPRGFKMCCNEGDHCIKPKPATTLMKVLTHGQYKGQTVTKVLLEPITGRRHQLRVHCASIGHCIVGDYTYSGGTDTDPYRMMLHSSTLQIPLQSGAVKVQAPDPFVREVDDDLTLFDSTPFLDKNGIPETKNKDL